MALYIPMYFSLYLENSSNLYKPLLFTLHESVVRGESSVKEIKTDFVIVTIVLNIGSKFIFPGIFVLQYNFICVLVMLLSSLSDKIEM